MSFRREPREFISPLLQPPLNKIFVPRPTPDYLPPIDRDEEARTYVKVEPTAKYLHLLQEPVRQPIEPTPPTRKERVERKRRAVREAIEAQISNWDPSKNESATEDPFKTIFIGRLPYDITESRLRREFERFGAIKTIKMITDKDGKPRGYAFIEYEREKDMKVAYMEGDAMRLEDGGRRIVVDVERGRTVKDWRPRRVAGGLGKTRVGGKEQNQRYSGRDVRANDMLAKMTDESGYNPRKRSPSPRRDHGRDRYDDRRRR